MPSPSTSSGQASECTRQAELWQDCVARAAQYVTGRKRRAEMAYGLFLIAEQARLCRAYAERHLAMQERQRQEWLQ